MPVPWVRAYFDDNEPWGAGPWSILDEPLKNQTQGEVFYHYIKGHGWIPETPLSLTLKAEREREDRAREEVAARMRQAAMPSNFGMPYGAYGVYRNDYERAAREARLERERRASRHDYGNATPVTITATTNTNTNTNTNTANLWYSMSYSNLEAQLYGYQGWARQVNQRPAPAPARTPTPPRPRTPDELAANTAVRYYPGSGERAENARPENQHERRIREYREAQERVRRGR